MKYEYPQPTRENYANLVMNSTCIVLNNEACHSMYEYNIETFETIGKLSVSRVETGCGWLWPVRVKLICFSNKNLSSNVLLQNYACVGGG